MLTRQQHRCWLFIADEFARNRGHAPTLAEIAAHLGLKSRSRVYVLVDALVERGYIATTRRRACSIRLLIKPPPAPPAALPSSAIPKTRDGIEAELDALEDRREYLITALDRLDEAETPSTPARKGDEPERPQA